MRLVALVEGVDHVCARYRLRAFERPLAALGHTLDLRPIPRGLWGRFTLRRLVADADIVVLQRRLLSWPEVALLRRAARHLWFDVDDAVWLRDSYAAKGFESRKRRGRFRAIARAADLVIAGNGFLAENARAMGASASTVIPTCVDPYRYPVAGHEAGPVDLVWIGSSSTLQGLEAIRPTLEDLGRRVPNLRLKVICDRFPTLEHLPVVKCPWGEATEAREIASASIGISWIPDDPWSRGKCGLKVLQYMAAGLPVVANPVGVHPEMVRPGATGYLVHTTEEWVQAVRALAADASLRRRLGEAGRGTVVDRYSIEAGTAKWAAAIAGQRIRRDL